ncbi:hypothetical protein D3C79_528740 [compost metagenome]
MQVLDFLLHSRGALDQQVVTGIAQVLQQAVAGQFLAAQRGQGIERRQLGIELVALVAVEWLAVLLAALEAEVDLLGTCLVVADFCLSPLWAGLRVDDQAVGIRQCLLQFALLRTALAEHLLQLWHVQGGVALGHRQGLAGLELDQLALAVGGFLGRASQLLLECLKLLFAVFLAEQQCQGLFQHLLLGLLLRCLLRSLGVGLGTLGLGDLVQAALDAGRGGKLGRASGERERQAQPEQGCAEVHAQGHRQTTCGSGRNEV